MAIQPPQFNVPLLNPAALLQGRDNDGFGESLDAMIRQSANFFYNSQLQERAQQGALQRALLSQEGAERRNLQDLEARGFIKKVDGEVPTISFPGEEAPREVPTINIGGQQYYRPEQAQGMQQEARLRTPLGPEQGYLPNTTVRDIEGVPGAPASDEDVAARQLAPAGSRESFETFVQSIPQGQEFEPLRRFAQSQLAAATSDDYITRQEASDLESAGFTMSSLKGYTERMRKIQDLSAERREQINKATQSVLADYRREVGDGIYEPLNFAEAQRVAVWRTAPELMTPEEIRETQDFVGTDIRPNPNIPDVYEDIERRFRAAGQTDTNEHFGAVQWLQHHMSQNEELHDMVVQSPAGGSASVTAIGNFLASGLPEAQALRSAYSLQGFSKREILERKTAGQAFPFGLEGRRGLYWAKGMTEPGWNDTPSTTGTDGVGADEPLTDDQIGQVMSSIQEQGWDADFDRLTSQMAPEARRAMTASLQGETASENAENLSRAATQLEQAGDAALAGVFRNLAAMAKDNRSAFLVARDSVMIPSLQSR